MCGGEEHWVPENCRWYITSNLIGRPFNNGSNGVDNKELIEVNNSIRNHPVEEVGAWLRESMTAMKKIV